MIHFSVFRIHFTRKRRFTRALARSLRGMVLLSRAPLRSIGLLRTALPGVF